MNFIWKCLVGRCFPVGNLFFLTLVSLIMFLSLIYALCFIYEWNRDHLNKSNTLVCHHTVLDPRHILVTLQLVTWNGQKSISLKWKKIYAGLSEKTHMLVLQQMSYWLGFLFVVVMWWPLGTKKCAKMM